jgi:GNAT superfamily N-acetyltransferase
MIFFPIMNNELSIRLALPEERDALEALQWRASLIREEDREALLAHPDAIDLPVQQMEGGSVLVAEREGKTVGFAVVLPRQDCDADLDGLFVEPDSWRAGIGTRLIKEVERLAESRGANMLRVVANPRAKEFYLARGFELTGQEPTRFGVGLTMVKAVGRRRARSLS